MDVGGSISFYEGFIHDCWASYLAYEHCGHGLCGSHLLRELTFIVEANGYVWALEMKRLLQKTAVTVSQRKNGLDHNSGRWTGLAGNDARNTLINSVKRSNT